VSGAWRRATLPAFAALTLAFAGSAHATAPIQAVTSPGGITAWLIEDHSVPVVSVEIAFRGGGAANDPADKAGLASLASSLLDEGAGDLDTTAFQTRIEDLATSLNFRTGQDNFIVHVRALSANLAPSLDLLGLALTSPRFDEAPLARERSATLDDLARSLRQPNPIAMRTWWEHEYPDSPYGRPVRGTPDSVNAITADDLRAFVKDRFAKDRMVIAVVGDVTAAALAPLLDKTFGGLTDHGAPDALSEVAAKPTDQLLLADLPIPQSVVVFGQPGIKRDDPDWYAGLLVLDILSSGGLTSRVALEVREERGLAYSVSASLDPLLHSGVILGQVGSQNAKVGQAIDLIRSEWRRMHDSGPTAKELADAKTYLTGSFPLGLDSTGRIASVLISIQIDHLGIDYLGRRDALIEKVTLADAKRVAKRILDPDNLLFVVVGAPQNLAGAEPVTPGG
jgi:zinc protease